MSASLLDRWPAVMSPALGTPGLALVRGQGAVVVDEAGKSYVDFLGGIAVNALGHAHPAVIAAVTRQIATLGHVSNLFAAEPPVQLAERLLSLVTGADFGGGTGPDGRVFFTNSGAEAVEAAFKLSRCAGRTHIVSTEGAFHGRTMGALALTGQPAKADPFRPTGHWFAYQAEGITPDAITLAKGLGGGLPIGALVALGPAGELLGPGMHASTFGGNPVSCAAALAVLDTIANEDLLDHVKRLGERLRRGIEGLDHPLVSGVRGAGLLLGVVLTAPASGALADLLRDAGFLVNAVQPGVLRLAPPLVIAEEQVDALIAALPAALAAAGVPQ
jgi:acetylornithine/N-succinyldiaminopimelate aminotransferase